MIHANTPSYVGRTSDGLRQHGPRRWSTTLPHRRGRIEVGGPGQRDPRLGRTGRYARDSPHLDLMGLETIVFPDTSGVLDCPQTGMHQMYPERRRDSEQLRATGDSQATIALGPICSGPAAKQLYAKCHVKQTTLPLPIGLKATDRFIMELRKYNGGYVPRNSSTSGAGWST